MADWWNDLVMTSPAGGGKNGMSGAENAELSKARDANEAGRSAFPMLAEMYKVAQRYPGGNPNAIMNRGLLGIGSNAPEAQDYQLFKKLQLKVAVPKAKLLGANPSNKDMENILASQASPEDRFGNNQTVIGLDYQEAARKYFENAFKLRWAAKNGGLNGRDQQGNAYPQALQAAFRNPQVKTAVTAPWNRQQARAPDTSDVDAILRKHGVMK